MATESLGLVSARYHVSFGPRRYGLCGVSCLSPRISLIPLAVVCDGLGGSDFPSLLKSFFLGCGCRASIGAGSLVSDTEICRQVEIYTLDVSPQDRLGPLSSASAPAVVLTH